MAAIKEDESITTRPTEALPVVKREPALDRK